MVDFVFNSFVTLTVVVDPLGLAPIFATLTRGYSEKRRRKAAIRGTVLGAAILLVFALAIPLLARRDYDSSPLHGGRSIRQIAVFVCVLLVVLLLTLASLLLAPRIVRLFGETGANVLSRMLGILLAALACSSSSTASSPASREEDVGRSVHDLYSLPWRTDL